MKPFFLICIAMIMGACSSTPSTPSATALPTTPPLQGFVNITHPQDGTVIYSEVIYLQGTAENIPHDGFLLRLVGTGNDVIAEILMQPTENNWSVELVHGYTGDPSEVTIFALPTNQAVIGDYDIQTVALATLDTRQEGIYGSILSPPDGNTVGGEMLLLFGRISGVKEFIVTLENADGLIDTVTVPVNIEYAINETAWQAELDISTVRGSGQIRMKTVGADDEEIVLDTINVFITDNAG